VERALDERGDRPHGRLRPSSPSATRRPKVTIFNSFEGHGFGKLIAGFARKAAAKVVDAFAHRIKAAVEAS